MGDTQILLLFLSGYSTCRKQGGDHFDRHFPALKSCHECILEVLSLRYSRSSLRSLHENHDSPKELLFSILKGNVGLVVAEVVLY